MNDSQAITRLKRGDIGGLEALVERYQLQAVRAAHLIIRDRQAAEDVVQDCFLRIYRSIGQFDAERPFAPYLFKSVINGALRVARQRERLFSLDETAEETEIETVADDAPLPDMEVERSEQRRLIWEALAQLSPDQRTVVVLRYYLNMSEDDMAAHLDVPQGTIKWRLHAARKRLRGLLREV